jgi:hypothetical protein
LKEQ